MTSSPERALFDNEGTWSGERAPPVRGRQEERTMRNPVGAGGIDPEPALHASDDLPPVVNAIVLVEAVNVGSAAVANVRDTTFQQ